MLIRIARERQNSATKMFGRWRNCGSLQEPTLAATRLKTLRRSERRQPGELLTTIRTGNPERRNTGRSPEMRQSYKSAARNVLQAATVPSRNPFPNQRWRCAEEPWVKEFRHHASGRLKLQRVVADRGCRLERRLDVAGFDQWRTALFHQPCILMVRPDAGEAIGLQFNLDLQAIGPDLVHALLLLLDFRHHAEQVLDVMADFMGDHIGLRELAGAPLAAMKPRLDFIEERGVRIDLLIVRAIERPHRALRHAATARGLALE